MTPVLTEIVENWQRQKRILEKDVSVHDTLDYFVDEGHDGIEILSDEESVPDLIHFDTDSDDDESVDNDRDSILIAGASQAGEGSIPSESNTTSLATLSFNRIPYGITQSEFTSALWK